MKLKTTPSSNLSYIGIMTALNVVFVLISHFLPISAFVLMIVLPMTTVLVTLFCQKKYILIYVIASLCLAIAVNPQDGIYYVTSSIACGLVFGTCIRNHLHPSWGIFLGAIASTILNFATLPLITLIFGVSIEDTFGTLFKINSNALPYVFCLFITLSSIMQTIFSSLIVYSQTKKYIMEEKTEPSYLIFGIIGLVLGLLTIGVSFFSAAVSFILLGFACLASSVSNKLIASKNLYWTFSIIIFLQISLFAIFYQLMGFPQGLSLIAIFPTLLSLVGIIVKCKKEHVKEVKTE